MQTDIEIARASTPKPIAIVAERLGIPADVLLPYGRLVAKVDRPFVEAVAAGQGPRGKLILVTAINPTAAGEGKTTTTIGLADALGHLGHKAAVAMREPSLGPCFGVKGGAAGGGFSQVVPMEQINLHFTGDFHAITAANNLLAAMIDNHIYHGNALNIDPRRVSWTRSVDMNDRALRDVVIGLGGPANGYPRQTKFEITVASEVMAVFCLARDLADLQARLRRMVVALDGDRRPVTADQLEAVGAMTVLLRDALMPNLAQTLEGTPAFIHGGPFANIAHGCNSVIATNLALGLADYVVTEAGFGADLGAEKFFDIKCRQAGLEPAAAVIVASGPARAGAGGVGHERVERGADGADDLEVGARLLGADGERGAGLGAFDGEHEGFGVVVDVEPIALVGAVAVDRQPLALEGVERDEGDELLRELPGAVVVGGVGDEGGQAVSVEPGAHEVVRGGLAGGIGAARVVRRGLGKGRVGGAEGAEHFVRRDVVEAERGLLLLVEGGPIGAGGVEQDEGADDVGVDERRRAIDGPVDVALGGQVHDGVRLVLGKHLAHGVGVADVGLDMEVAGVVQGALQRVLGGGVGHLVDVDDVVAGRADQVADHRRADEATAAGEQDTHGNTSLKPSGSRHQAGWLDRPILLRCKPRTRPHARWIGSTHFTASGCSTAGMSRLTTTASLSLRTRTHSRVSSVLALISWCGT